MSFSQSFATTMRALEDNERFQREKKIKKEIGDVTKAEESGAFTVDQGAELDALANAKDADGNAYYKVDATPDGKYQVTPTFKNETGDAPTDYAPSTVAQKGVSFLGKTYDAPLTDTQRDTARTYAMAGVYQQNGEPEQATRLRMLSQQMEQTDKQGKLTDLQIKSAERADKQGQMDQEWQNGRQDLFKSSEFARNQAADAAAAEKYKADMAAYQARVQSGDHTGIAPVAPQKSTYTVGQSLIDNLTAVQHDLSYGKGDPSKLMELAKAKQTLDEEGYGRALKLAQGGATVEQLAAEFNKSGNVKLDPKSVVSDQMVDRGQGVKSRVLTFRDEKGQMHTIDTMAELDSLGKADALFSRMFEAKRIDQGDQNIKLHQQGVNIQGGQLRLAQNADKRANTEFEAGAPARQVASTLSTLQLALGNTNDPTERAAIQDKITAIQSGVGVGKEQPAEVKLAQAMVKAGMYPDMRTALEVAITKKGQSADEIHQGFVQAGIKNMSPADDAVKKADEAMAAMGYTKKNGRWSQGGGAADTVAKFGTAAEAEAAVKAGKIKAGDKVEINGRTATYKP